MVAAVYCAALLLFFVITATCQQYPTCHKAHTAFCEDPVYGLTSNNLIFRCQYASGDAEPGNCNDDLADVPPLGLKYTYCWESSPTAGDAQCTYNCVRVTAANGTSFYPVGCNRTEASSTSGQSTTGSTSLTSFGRTTTTASVTSRTSSADATPTLVRGSSTGLWPLLAILGGYLTL